MNIYIDGSGNRFDPKCTHTVDDVMYYGTILGYPQALAALGVVIVAEPTPPVDYSEDTYTIEKIDTAPYVVYTRRSDAEIAASRWIKIKAKRDELTDNGGLLVSGKWFHTDTKSKQQQMALTMLGAAIPENLQWKTMDGSFITMTQTLAGQLFAAQIGREQTIFAHAEILKADINADINAGWPARYETAPL